MAFAWRLPRRERSSLQACTSPQVRGLITQTTTCLPRSLQLNLKQENQANSKLTRVKLTRVIVVASNCCGFWLNAHDRIKSF